MIERRVQDRRTSAGTGADHFPIEELARLTGMTVRNIRAYQSRGVLHPPVLERRTGYYDHSHVERVETVHDLINSGLTLNAVHALLVGRSDLASDMSRLLMEAEEVDLRHPDRRRRADPIGPFPTSRLEIDLGAMDAQADAGQTISRMIATADDPHQDSDGPLLELRERWDLFTEALPADEVFQLVLRLDSLTDTAVEHWIAALAPYWDAAAPNGEDPDAARTLAERLNPAAVEFAVALFELALRRRTAEVLAGRTHSVRPSRVR